MNSMTGYGRAQVEIQGRSLTIEVKTVNHRFLDVSFRMPRSFGFLEDEARRMIAARLARGHVDVYANYRNLRTDARQVTVDAALLEGYQAALEETARLTGAADRPGLMDYARLPDVLMVSEAEEDREALGALMAAALGEALEQVTRMRTREGVQLAKDVAGRIDALERMTGEIEMRGPEMIAAYQERLQRRIEELVGNQADEQRILTEVAIMADRSAISEETVRLRSHFAQARSMIEASEPVGRKLDFLVQELNREMNTISSKSQDIPITQIVVSAKAEIEKIREQVQNIE